MTTNMDAAMDSMEVLYAISVNRHNSLVLTKFSDSSEPGDSYTITNRGRGMCNCFGASRNPGGCKHRKIAQELHALSAKDKIPLMGGFYNYETKTFYTPEDHEGVPLQNLVDIWGMAIEQGKAY